MIPVIKMFGWANYMRYDELGLIASQMFSNTSMANETEVNVYLDMGSMTDVLYSSAVKEGKDPTELASVVLNLAGHVRAFFKTCGVFATVFIVYSKNDWSVLRQLCPEYNSKSHKKDRPGVSKYIKDSMRLVKMITPYLNRVYYIDGEAECGAMIYGTIQEERAIGNTHPNIIFTKEINLLQIPAIDPYSVIFNKHARGQQRVCYGINQANVMEIYSRLTKRYNPAYFNPGAAIVIKMVNGVPQFVDVTRRVRDIGEILRRFNPYKLPYLIALTNLYSRSIGFLMTWTEALKALDSMDPFVDDPLWVYNKMSPDIKIFNHIGYDEFVGRFQAISIAYQSQFYSKGGHSDYHIDLMNSDELKHLNDHYFIKNPIDLNKF